MSDEKRRCDTCNGTGVVEVELGLGLIPIVKTEVTCRSCQGRGVLMPGNKSRGKGARREYEARDLLPGATKISKMYQEGPDIRWQDLDVEVKARADGWKELHKWLKNANLLMLKADRRDWLVVMRHSTMMDLLEAKEEGTP